MRDDLDAIVAVVAADYFRATPFASDTGSDAAANFVEQMLKLLHRPGLLLRAREAADKCDVKPLERFTALQSNMRPALIGYYLARARPHPWRQRKAGCWADTIVAEFNIANETAAMLETRRRARVDPLEAAAREREAKIERNRRRPRRQPLYPV
jgi:hypothetical protein